ncbi:RNA-guided endonuclease TnpB family protein [uncultured Thermomonospora sp.]|uniref:RNA-guided endonuclease TnpB family protein n=1 Tax=uncultured Thermomonospora sp. TaxID=671175 RepID=UPI00259BCB56|nr:RNA-guided endonuclease TnpB family protein [uncultured Thermomonospora sp.]
MSEQTRFHAFRYTLAPTPSQEAAFFRYAGAALWAYNHAIGVKKAAHQEWRTQVDALVASGIPEEQARKQVKVKIPNSFEIGKNFNRIKGDSREGIDGICPWWHEVNRYCFKSAFADADQAWKNWLASLKGTRKGRKVGYPRFKSKRHSRRSFRLYEGIRPVGYRRLRLPSLGEIRIHGTTKPLVKLLNSGQATIKAVTVSQGGHRWYASVLCEVTTNLPDGPTRRQRSRGTIGVDMGVKNLATLSKPLNPDDPTTAIVPNPRHLEATDRRLRRAQRALARKQKGSKRREKAARRVARLHHQVAVRRATAIHELTKQLATSFEAVAIEDLNVQGMTRTAKGTIDRPGRNVKAKAGLNRAILDAGFGELRRQLEYKTTWYGSRLLTVDRWMPSSKTCSGCGWKAPELLLQTRVFRCGGCGLVLDRDVNAARNIERHAA